VSIFSNPRSRPPARIERWALRLQPWQATVKYNSGRDNPVDNLTRHHPAETEESGREERVMEENINYTATTSTPKSMMLSD